ncbi:MAG TPA: hypothetical protein VFW98_12815 [Gemmatimonadaceae bacterium]|nr:hypothetical protein [Gemmatimonadaceae bacterium]
MLGTGTPAADPDRFGSALVVLVDTIPYLFDVGVEVVEKGPRRALDVYGPKGLRPMTTHILA